MSLRRDAITRLNEARKSGRPTIGKGKPLNSQGDDGDLTFRRTSDGLKLYIKAAGKWNGVKVGESFDDLEKSLKSLQKIVSTIKKFRLPNIYSVTGDFTLDASGNITLNSDGGRTIIKDNTASHFLFDCGTTSLTIYDDTDEADVFTITVGASGASSISTTDDGAAIGHLTLVPDGDLILDPVSQKTIINATDGLYFDGGGDTYIYEQGADILRVVVGGDQLLELTEDGDDGNSVNFKNSCAGFTQIEPVYNASITPVDFRRSNKQNLTFGAGNITNLQLFFPLVSGNFTLLIKQDGTGSRTITNWRAYEYDESTADGNAGVVFAGGSNPTLTTDANHVDIISFYWDADNEIAYGVATLDFQF
tara:strand:+ start:253 stop:1341 length:1089 start_codon:yes stop_codon:yes gene_type:complete